MKTQDWKKITNGNLKSSNFSQKAKKKILWRLIITTPNGSKILKKDPIFLIFSLLSDHQQENLVTGFSEEDPTNILNTVDLKKANNNDKRRSNALLNHILKIMKYSSALYQEKPHMLDTVKDNKKKILIMSDIHVRRIDRKKLQN